VLQGHAGTAWPCTARCQSFNGNKHECPPPRTTCTAATVRRKKTKDTQTSLKTSLPGTCRAALTGLAGQSSCAVFVAAGIGNRRGRGPKRSIAIPIPIAIPIAIWTDIVAGIRVAHGPLSIVRIFSRPFAPLCPLWLNLHGRSCGSRSPCLDSNYGRSHRISRPQAGAWKR